MTGVKVEHKFCHKCATSRPVGNFGRDKTTKDKLTTCCKACRNLMSKSWRRNNPEKAKQSVRTWTDNNLDFCLERARKRAKEFREALPEGEYARIQREWRKKNPEKAKNHYVRSVNKYGKAYKLRLNTEHRRRNRDKYLRIDADKRAKRLLRYVEWADKEAIEQVYAEARRMTFLTGEQHHVDHEVPLQGKFVCGLHNEFNLRVVTAKVNLSKGAKFEVSS